MACLRVHAVPSASSPEHRLTPWSHQPRITRRNPRSVCQGPTDQAVKDAKNFYPRPITSHGGKLWINASARSPSDTRARPVRTSRLMAFAPRVPRAGRIRDRRRGYSPVRAARFCQQPRRGEAGEGREVKNATPRTFGMRVVWSWRVRSPKPRTCASDWVRVRDVHPRGLGERTRQHSQRSIISCIFAPSRCFAPSRLIAGRRGAEVSPRSHASGPSTGRIIAHLRPVSTNPSPWYSRSAGALR